MEEIVKRIQNVLLHRKGDDGQPPYLGTPPNWPCTKTGKTELAKKWSCHWPSWHDHRRSSQPTKNCGMILDETLRLYAPAVMLMRETSKGVQLRTFKLPAATQLYLAILAVHHDCELWSEDAEEFNPMRFSEPSKHLAAFFPFDLGPRICVDQHLAAVEGRIIVAMVLRCFALKVSSSYVQAPIQFITLRPEFGAPILFEKI